MKKPFCIFQHVNSRESSGKGKKGREVEYILHTLGDWLGLEEETGFHRIKTANGRIIKVADLVEDNPIKRDRVSAALKDPAQKNNRDHVDIIIALGMAKEGFDWIWCEHALTVGYRDSLTEVVQIIGRTTRDAPGKNRARFTNLIAEPDASESAVTEAVNDTLKAIAGSLLMEQVLTPKFKFTPKTPDSTAEDGFDYGETGYQNGKCNIGEHRETGEIRVELKGLKEPKSEIAKQICEDPTGLLTMIYQDKPTLENGLFGAGDKTNKLNKEMIPKLIRNKFPNESVEDQEAIRQRLVAAMNIPQKTREYARSTEEKIANTAFVDNVRKFALDVRELDVDLIDSINPFDETYAILSKTMDEKSLEKIIGVISARKSKLTQDDARNLLRRAAEFNRKEGRLPSHMSHDPWERQMAEGMAYMAAIGQKEVNETTLDDEVEPESKTLSLSF